MSSEGVPSGQGDARDSEVSVTTDSDVVSSDKRMVRERERRAAKELERKRLDLEQKRFKEYANEKFTDFHSQQGLFVTPFRWRLLMRACRV